MAAATNKVNFNIPIQAPPLATHFRIHKKQKTSARQGIHLENNTPKRRPRRRSFVPPFRHNLSFTFFLHLLGGSFSRRQPPWPSVYLYSARIRPTVYDAPPSTTIFIGRHVHPGNTDRRYRSDTTAADLCVTLAGVSSRPPFSCCPSSCRNLASKLYQKSMVDSSQLGDATALNHVIITRPFKVARGPPLSSRAVIVCIVADHRHITNINLLPIRCLPPSPAPSRVT